MKTLKLKYEVGATDACTKHMMEVEKGSSKIDFFLFGGWFLSVLGNGN